jgi:hypothetical protein
MSVLQLSRNQKYLNDLLTIFYSFSFSIFLRNICFPKITFSFQNILRIFFEVSEASSAMSDGKSFVSELNHLAEEGNLKQCALGLSLPSTRIYCFLLVVMWIKKIEKKYFEKSQRSFLERSSSQTLCS